jgi:hypothetical protein
VYPINRGAAPIERGAEHACAADAKYHMATMRRDIGASVDAAAWPPPDERDLELKFTMPEGRVELARRLLGAICLRDRQFPAAVVWTIYYDTPALTSLGEKINSEYLKLKVRLRWYSGVTGAASGPAFIEAKSRIGTRRAKVRVRVPYVAEDLATWDLQDPRLQSLPLLLRECGILVRDLQQPTMLIRYRRDRFIEPVTRARISLDTEIAAAAVNRRFLAAADQRPICTGILEVKGKGDELPLALRPLLRLGARKRSFSKFLAVYLHATGRIL